MREDLVKAVKSMQGQEEATRRIAQHGPIASRHDST
jgi:hypothetical protein